MRALKVPSTARLSAAESTSGDACASVVRTASIVAMFGAIIPAPLAIPPTRKVPPSRVTCFGCVSVVRIAVAAAVAWSGERPRPPTRAGAAASMVSIGRAKPMRPVEQTSTSSTPAPSGPATAAAMRSAATSPAAPVAALAQPLLRMTAAALPAVAARWARLTTTGAAQDLFVVKVAAAGTAPDTAATSARSARPPGLIPAAAPFATKPRAQVTLTASPPPGAGPKSRRGRARCSPPGSPARRRPW